jgi:hypothetical protein
LKAAVAALMLTFITAITAGFFVYNFISNLTESMKTAFPIQPLRRESAYINNTCLTIYIRNYASVNIQIMEAYVNGNTCDLTENVIISPGTNGILHLYGAYRKGGTYNVEITPSIGSALLFNINYE